MSLWRKRERVPKKNSVGVVRLMPRQEKIRRKKRREEFGIKFIDK